MQRYQQHLYQLEQQLRYLQQQVGAAMKNDPDIQQVLLALQSEINTQRRVLLQLPY